MKKKHLFLKSWGNIPLFGFCYLLSTFVIENSLGTCPSKKFLCSDAVIYHFEPILRSVNSGEFFLQHASGCYTLWLSLTWSWNISGAQKIIAISCHCHPGNLSFEVYFSVLNYCYPFVKVARLPLDNNHFDNNNNGHFLPAKGRKMTYLQVTGLFSELEKDTFIIFWNCR